MRKQLIGAGLRVIRASRIDRVAANLTRGLGAILMFHHVRPDNPERAGFRPNGLLEITPEFLDAVIVTLRRLSFEILDLDTAAARIAGPSRPEAQPFAVLTFDDGYRDNVEHALPVLRRRGAPFTLYVTTGFADRTARLWWHELELAIARADEIDVEIGSERLKLPAASDMEKTRAYEILYRRLRGGPEETLLTVIGDLADRYGVDGRKLVEDECLDFQEIVALAREPLCTIGAHTLTHPMLAKRDIAVVRRELGESRELIAAWIGRAVSDVAYPVGDPTSAGPREFSAARDAGFVTGVTTRPGMIFACHAAHLTALPRLSINGNWQEIGYVEALLSGVPFALWNGGRRLNVA
ncbi:MAG: polysaccharide deacetylase family protein [Methylobacteriaceae bacterium]|nr:polysaccharide deacetylase family protein [Methylobacteriaceae bacterium]